MATSANRDLARAMCAASLALASLPLAKLPRMYRAATIWDDGHPCLDILVAGGGLAGTVATVRAWAQALPGSVIHAVQSTGGAQWYVRVRGELGTVPVEVWNLVDVDDALAADLDAAGDSAAAGALLVERLGGGAS